MKYAIENDRIAILDFVGRQQWSRTIGQRNRFKPAFVAAAKKGSKVYMQKLFAIVELDVSPTEPGGSSAKRVPAHQHLVESAIKHGNLHLAEYLYSIVF